VKTVDLAPLSPQEISEFVERQIVEYADEKRRAGHWTADEAIKRSRAAIQDLLGDDPGARGHRFFKGLSEPGERVGWIWIGPPPEVFQLQRAQWLFQITVDEKFRGRGFGRGMLVALEALLAAEDIEALHLNVFKWNLVARNLYDSLGYEVYLETDSEAGMSKRLRSPPRQEPGRRT
jgi:ribosomal protein S18 acetylase RimI-like enzyme